MKKRRRSDRKKYQAEHGWDYTDATHTRSRQAKHFYKHDVLRGEKYYGEPFFWIPKKDQVLHVAGNSYRWESK